MWFSMPRQPRPTNVVVVVLLGRAIACAGEQAAQSGGSLAQDQAAVLVHEAVAGGTADLSRLGWRFP